MSAKVFRSQLQTRKTLPVQTNSVSTFATHLTAFLSVSHRTGIVASFHSDYPSFRNDYLADGPHPFGSAHRYKTAGQFTGKGIEHSSPTYWAVRDRRRTSDRQRDKPTRTKKAHQAYTARRVRKSKDLVRVSFDRFALRRCHRQRSCFRSQKCDRDRRRQLADLVLNPAGRSKSYRHRLDEAL